MIALPAIASILTKLPLIGTIVGFFKSKYRLIIEYVLIAVVIAAAGFSYAVWAQKKKTQETLEQVQSRLTTVELTSAIQDETIGDLLEARQRDSQALQGLIEDLQELSQFDENARKRLQALEKSNENVRSYLDSVIPPELSCVLDGTC